MTDLLKSLELNAPINTGPINTRVQAIMLEHNKRGRRPLNPFEARDLANGEENLFYVYNVSPIHEWKRPQGQLGTIVIPKRKWEAKVSIAVPIKGAIVRWAKLGVGLEQPLLEGGKEIVEDICGSGDLFDGRNASSNLTQHGVFYCEKPFTPEFLPERKRQQLAQAKGAAAEQLHREFILPLHEQEESVNTATSKLLNSLQDRILEADNYYMGGPEQRRYVQSCDWFRQCLKAFNHITGQKIVKPWSSIQINDALEACKFCGNQNKPNLAVCPNCKNVLDHEAYEALTAKPVRKGKEAKEA